MGWCSFRLEKSNESVSNWFINGFNREKYECIKHSIVGNVIYGAIRNKENGNVFAVIYLISWNEKDYNFNFSYKDMDETCMPYYYNCPLSLIKLLSPLVGDDYSTNNARKWRENVIQYHNEKKISKNKDSYFKLDSPLKFTNGMEFDIFKDYGKHRYAGSIVDGVFKPIAKVSKFSLKYRTVEYLLENRVAHTQMSI